MGGVDAATPTPTTVYDPSEERVSVMRERFGCDAAPSCADAAVGADIVVLAVKPQHCDRVFDQLRPGLKRDALVISVVAGKTVRDLSYGLRAQHVVRTIPNIPACIRQGVTVWCTTQDMPRDLRHSARELLRCLGDEVYVEDEEYLDMATALSGTGPAYAFLVAESMIDAGVHMGLPRDTATALVLKTIQGSTDYLRDSGRHPASVRNDITSPGGTTASALYALEQGGLRNVMSDGVWAAYRRTRELGGKNPNVGHGRNAYQPVNTESLSNQRSGWAGSGLD